MEEEITSGKDTLALHQLPDDVVSLLQRIDVPPYLLAHLIVVHDVARRLVVGVGRHWPEIPIDAEAVHFGAATHDIGKVRHPEELMAPGEKHRTAGVALLEEHGAPPRLARFARTHAAWRKEEDATVEDLLVALADEVWKGSRDEELETALLERLAASKNSELWEAYMKLDELLTTLAAEADRRHLWQAQFLEEEALKQAAWPAAPAVLEGDEDE
ncbi:MAG: HDIG domain-containing protein [Candidatus Promineifilaceae bacterium]|nr:HDIG domain-containing protein [Candidatus Promineifilaceae bacterium]